MDNSANNRKRTVQPVILLLLLLGVMYFAASTVGYSGTTASQYAQMNDGYVKMSSGLFALLFGGVCLLWIALCAFTARWFGVNDPRTDKREYVPLFVFVLSALVLRVVLSLCVTGYESDVSCFKAWGWRMVHNGPVGFYAEDYFCDYPPGYLYLLAIPQWFCELLNLPLGSAGSTMFYKLPAIAADVLIAVLIYRRFYPRYGHMNAAFAACAILFSPAMWLDSAVWGQVESVLMLFLLLCYFALEDDRIPAGCLWYAAAVLVKPQALLFGPILAVYAVHYFIRKKREAIRPALLGAAGAVALCAAVCVPMCIGQASDVLLSKYFGTMTSYPYITLNALNLYQFFGLNNAPLDKVFLGLTFRTWTWIGTGISAALAAFVYWRYRNDRPLVISSVVLIWALYLFGPSMHERYLMPVVVLLVVLAWQRDDKRHFAAACSVSLVQFAAMAGVLRTMHFANGYPLAVFFTCLNLLTFAAFTFCVLRAPAARNAERSENLPPLPKAKDGVRAAVGKIKAYVMNFADHPMKPKRLLWTRIDTLLVCVITAAYALVGFANLGDRYWPETWWEPQSWGENYVYDFGSAQEVGWYNICEGIGDGALQFEYSIDGEHWTALGEKWETSYADFFSWKRVDNAFTARYVRLSVMNLGCRIYEIGFFTPDGELLPVSTGYIGHDDENPFENTIDEQSFVPVRPDYKNSSYFDEVYHARTAYEQIKGWPIYEQTHPPLGKDIMMLGIHMFGMNPFGWRFMGTLAGVLMVPVIYIFGKALFQKTKWAAMLAALLSLDFMHYAQTRIATIDSFSVLFILLMYLFMFLYLQEDFFAEKQRRAFAYLALSGIFFGIGAATKWICIYAGAGLAVIFFWSVFIRFLRWKKAKRIAEAAQSADETPTESAELERNRQMANRFRLNLARTILWCCVFFVLIPCVIYCLSYLPYVGVEGQPDGLLNIVLQNQEYMFRYHSEYVLQMQDSPHPYQSAWYTWPFIGRPIFYYMGEYLPDGLVAGISSFGNPAIWWFGIFAIGWLIACLFRKQDDTLLAYDVPRGDYTRWFILAGLLAQFLPWVLVPRSTYIYHYFATTPFMMMAITAFFRDVYEYQKPKRSAWAWTVGYVALCIVLFVWFYPLLTGVPTTKLHAELSRWLPGWVLYGYWL